MSAGKTLSVVFLFAVASTLGIVLTAHAQFGIARRHVRRAAVVTTAVVTSTAVATESAAAHQAQAAQQQSAQAQQQSAQAAQQSAAAAEEAARAATQAAQAANAAAPSQAHTAVASLPAGCTASGSVYSCGGVYYKPFFQGTTVVYEMVPGP